MVWTSIMFAGMGSQMETLVVAWLVLTMTDSPFLVGLISAVRLATNFIALFAGAVANWIAPDGTRGRSSIDAVDP